MSVNQQDIAVLGDKLAQGGDGVMLSDAERQLVVAALKELTATSDVAARQALLLASYDADTTSVERDTRQAFAALDQRLSAAPASAGYDFAGAAAARQTLEQAVRDAGTLGQWLTAALSFAARLVG